jgi:hypothetical protein
VDLVSNTNPPSVSRSLQELHHLLGMMVDVHQNLLDPNRPEGFQPILKKWASSDRHKWLRPLVRQRAKAATYSGCQ